MTLKMGDVAVRLELARNSNVSTDYIDALIGVLLDGLSSTQEEALEFITDGHQWSTPAELARKMNISETYANNLLKHLCDLGLAQRRATSNKFLEYQYAPRMYE